MSVPTSEIPQARQDRARGVVDSAVFGSLPSTIQDRLIRELDRGIDSPSTVEAYRGLVVVDFARLPEADQGRMLDCLRLRPDADHGMLLGFVADVIHQTAPPADVRTRIIDVACLPLQTESLSDRDDRLALRAHYLQGQTERLSILMELIRMDGFRSASPADRVRALDVFAAAPPSTSGRWILPLLNANPTDPPPDWTRRRSGTAPLFIRDLRDQGSLLDHLHRLAMGQLDGRVEVTPLHRPVQVRQNDGSVQTQNYVFRERSIVADLAGVEEQHSRSLVLGDLLGEVSSPYQNMDQDNRGTCVLTTFLQRLANYCPAEYARLAVDLLMSGQSTLQDGNTFQPPSDAFATDSSSRSVTERLTQSSLARYWAGGTISRRGQPRDDLYRNVMPRRRTGGVPGGEQSDGFQGRYSRTQDLQDMERTVRSLFGIQYRVVTTGIVELLQNELRDHPRTPVFACMRWGVTVRRQQGAASTERWSAHCVDVMRLLEETPRRVAYWNPWGAYTQAMVNGAPVIWAAIPERGTQDRAGRGGPARRSEHASWGYQSITLADFRRLTQILIVPP